MASLKPFVMQVTANMAMGDVNMWKEMQDGTALSVFVGGPEKGRTQ